MASIFRKLKDILITKSGQYRDRYGKNCKSQSLDFRRNAAAIFRGELPEKYTELVGMIPGERVVEVGAGEGVLALAVSANKQAVRAIDFTPLRHEKGKEIQAAWRALGKDVDRCELVLGDVFEDPSLLDGFDTLVASRVIYYFGERTDLFMELVSARVNNIVLVGNSRRAKRYARGHVSKDLGDAARLSTPEGMRDILEKWGYEVVLETFDHDPTVIGKRKVPLV